MAEAETKKSVPVQNGKGGANGGKNGDPDQPKRTKHRSPNFPVFGLQKAVERVTELYNLERRNLVPITVAHAHWGYKPSSGAGNQAVAALRAYGLLEVQGEGDQRRVRVSDRGHRITLQGPGYEALLKESALLPMVHSQIWKRYQSEGLPTDATLRDYLIWDLKFNEDSVDAFIAQFNATVAYAKLTLGDKIGDEQSPEAEDGKAPTIEVGSYVQWESQGVAQFPQPRKVTGKSDDGSHLFIEGNVTGIPVEQVRVEQPPKALAPPLCEKPAAPPVAPRAPIAPAPPGTKQDTFAADTGVVVIQWPAILSKADYDDLTGWLDMLKRKIGRSVPTDDKSN